MKVVKVGETWQGGVYAGITHKNEHLVLMFPHQSKRDMTCVDAFDLADHRNVAIHTSKPIWRLPTRKEAALLYANLQDWFEDMWYWTGEAYHADTSCNWVQTFGYGRQADARRTDACRVCLVRSFPCE
jgi:hypothetical protein